MTKNRWAVATLSVAAMISTACSDSQSTQSDSLNAQEDESRGRLSVSMSALDSDDVIGFDFEVADSSGAVVATRFVPLEDELIRFVDAGYVPLVDGGVDGGTMSQGAAVHRFADALFVLSPGTYVVTATPRSTGDAGSARCAPAMGTALITASGTTEIVLVSACRGTANGTLDVVAVLNHTPSIDDLAFGGSKFAVTCECVRMSLTASDPDGDALAYAWEVVSAPAGATYDLATSGASARFVTHAPGNYGVTVSACDTSPAPLCSALSFPLHIAAGPTDCPLSCAEDPSTPAPR